MNVSRETNLISENIELLRVSSSPVVYNALMDIKGGS